MPLATNELLTLADQGHAKNGVIKGTNVKSTIPDNMAGPSTPGTRYRHTTLLPPIHHAKHVGIERDDPVCSLCGIKHGDGACYMTESSENLAEYRQMLILHADDEPMEDRVLICAFPYFLQLTLKSTSSKRLSELSTRPFINEVKCT